MLNKEELEELHRMVFHDYVEDARARGLKMIKIIERKPENKMQVSCSRYRNFYIVPRTR